MMQSGPLTNGFILLFALFVTPLLSASLTEEINTCLESSSVAAKGHVGVLVMDAESGESLYAKDEDRLFTPASNAKIFTSAASLDIFGPNHTFETWVGISGEITNGKLDGDLYLIGRGDPVLKTPELKAIADSISSYGISEITGDIVVDVSLFSSEFKGPGWMWDDNPYSYSMSISPLMLNYNVAALTVQNTPSGAFVATFNPPTVYPEIRWAETTGPVRITRRPFESEFIVSGSTMPEGRSSVSSSLAVYDPPLWIGNVFKTMLEERGVLFIGGYGSSNNHDRLVSHVRVGVSPPSTEIIHRAESLPMSEIVALFNKPSENAIGEILWHHLALENGSVPANWSSGRSAMYSWLAENAGIPNRTVRLEDGSGLTRYNLITPDATVKVLKYMWDSDNRQVYMDSMPVSGRDGTLQSRGTQVGGKVVAKTGTMSGVSCLSGYVQTEAGDWKIFSVLVNGYIGSSAPARKLQDEICGIIMKHGNPAATNQ